MTSCTALVINGAMAQEDRSGSTLAERYHLRERLGRGGMATVYRGFDAVLSREVAVKILHRERAAADYRMRMLQEGRAAVRAEHPHLMRVFDVGCVDDTTFMVMELLRGVSLAERMTAARMPWESVVRLLLPATDAFAALHAAGLVHRDIKPANLFIRRRDETDEVVVIDFGIAKMSADLFSQVGVIETATGTLIGTPAYMAPEHGNGEPADERSDIYSLGVTLYEALARRLPFPWEPGDNWMSMLVKHMYEEVPPLPDDIPPAVRDLVLRALAKRPDERFQTMTELATALRTCLDPPDAAAPRALNRAATTPPRLSWALVGAALAVTTVVAATNATTTTTPVEARVAPADVIRDQRRFFGPTVIPEQAPAPSPEPPPHLERNDEQVRKAELARLDPVVFACMHANGDPDANAVTMSLRLDGRGAVTAARLTGRRGARVGACIVEGAAGQRFAARGTLVHTFRRTAR
jgi:tRNA A-37 threonylcarbamoyl transferase component Bud32